LLCKCGNLLVRNSSKRVIPMKHVSAGIAFAVAASIYMLSQTKRRNRGQQQ
jgi:hypothetical protein